MRPLLTVLAIGALGASGGSFTLCAQGFETRWTAESWRLPSDEPRMGVLGLQVHRTWPSGGYAGFGGWGSLTGQRGGFITMGLSGGWRWPLTERLALDSSLWVGGGGVGRAAVGGGLQVRGHAGLSWDTGWGRMGLEASRVRFPNGLIDSRQLALTATLPFHLPVNVPASAGREAWGGGFREVTFLTGAQRYQPVGGARLLDGGVGIAALDLPGFEARAQWGESSFVDLDMSAAARGVADGYMDVFLGIGWWGELGSGLSWVTRIGAGPAGGGNLDVGGGAAYKVMAGLDAKLGPRFLASLQAGFVGTPSASFKAKVLGLSLGQRFDFGTPSTRTVPADRVWEDSQWFFRPSFIRIAHPQRRGTVDGPDLEQVGLQFGYGVGQGFEIIGQGNFATAGKAGGFAQGLVGLAWRSPSFGEWGPRLRLQALAGASGGGGVDTGGGLTVQPAAGLEQSLGKGWGLQLLLGRVRTPKGKLDAPVAEAGVVWRFTLPVAR